MPERIVIADDDQDIQEIVAFVLGQHGFVVETASNGQQLKRLLALQLPDLIILDVMMPGEHGYQLCASLRKDPRTQHIPIIMLTAHAEDIYERISVDLGAAYHITKPFHPLALANKVIAILDTEKS